MPEAAIHAPGGGEFSGCALDSLVSAGPFAEVWKATRFRGGAAIAVKVATSEEGARMLRAEGAVADRFVDVPGIVPIIDRGDAPLAHVVMPWVGEWTLRQIWDGEAHHDVKRRMKGRRAILWAGTPRRVLDQIRAGTPEGRFHRLRAFLGVLETVRVLHVRGLVHGDLKPENVLIGEHDGKPWITDFGLARELQAFRLEQRLDHSMHTDKGLVGGTLAYLPPEGVRGGEPSPSGDVYALGVMLHEALLFGRPDKARGTRALRQLPRSLARVLRRALAYDPAKRYPDAREMLLALRQALETAAVSEQIRPHGPSKKLRGGIRRFCGVSLLLSYVVLALCGILLQPVLLTAFLFVMFLHRCVWEVIQEPKLGRRWHQVIGMRSKRPVSGAQNVPRIR